MKKLVLLFSTVFLLTSFTVAQNYAKKGTWELGGSASFTSNSFVINGESGDISEGIEMPSATTFLLNIPVSYFVVDGFSIGIVPEFASLSAGNNVVDISLSAFGALFQAAYAFKTGGSVYPYLGGQVGYSTATLTLEIDDSVLGLLPVLKSNGTQTTQTVEPSASGLAWGVNGGIKIQLGKAALLNIGIGYFQRTYTPDEDQDLGIPGDLDRTGVDTFMGSLGFSVFLGK